MFTRKKNWLVLIIVTIYLTGLFGFVWAKWQTPPRSINFLLLGVSGGDHAGHDLTDTLVLVNINPQTQRATLISLPRDLWIKPLKIKLNAAYYYGGFDLVQSQIQKITSIKPDFTVLLNFQGFRAMIDLVGGVEVEVERDFEDYQYPREDEKGIPVTEGEIYEHIRFEKGPQLFDGATALKFIRSRNSKDPQEGTDFARSLRQQKVLLAFKNKVSSPKFFLTPNKVRQMMIIIQEQAQTSLDHNQISRLAKQAYWLPKIKKTAAYSLGNGDQLLVNPPLSKYNQWVLEPRTNDWQEIRNFISQILASLPSDETTKRPKAN